MTDQQLEHRAAKTFRRAREAAGDDTAINIVMRALDNTSHKERRDLLLQMLAVAGVQLAQAANTAPRRRNHPTPATLTNAVLAVARVCRQLDRARTSNYLGTR